MGTTSLSYPAGPSRPTGAYSYPVPRSDSASSVKPDPKRPKVTLKIEPSVLAKQQGRQQG